MDALQPDTDCNNSMSDLLQPYVLQSEAPAAEELSQDRIRRYVVERDPEKIVEEL